MTTLKEYQERINALARAKGWSDDLHWLELGTFKELGELVQEMEKHEDRVRTLQTEEKYQGIHQNEINSIMANTRYNLAKEFGDVIFFLFQAMHHFDINLDDALEMVIKDNTEKKKKTIDEKGNIVRK